MVLKKIMALNYNLETPNCEMNSIQIYYIK